MSSFSYWSSRSYSSFVMVTVSPVWLHGNPEEVTACAPAAIRSVSTAAAIDELRSGEAGAFRACADRRLAVLEDAQIRDAKLEPFPVQPWLLYYTDIAEDPDEWVNISMAAYYGKDSVSFPGY